MRLPSSPSPSCPSPLVYSFFFSFFPVFTNVVTKQFLEQLASADEHEVVQEVQVLSPPVSLSSPSFKTRFLISFRSSLAITTLSTMSSSPSILVLLLQSPPRALSDSTLSPLVTPFRIGSLPSIAWARASSRPSSPSKSAPMFARRSPPRSPCSLPVMLSYDYPPPAPLSFSFSLPFFSF